jgi:Flp pilus assembly protein CpaB
MRHPFTARRTVESVRSWQPSVLRRLLRRPAVWWSAAALLALATAAASHELLAEASSQRDSWARRHVVVVTTTAIEPGTQLGSANVATIELPAVALPDRFLTAVVPGATAATRLEQGEIIHPARLLGGNSVGDDRVAVAVPTGDLDGLLATGDVVDVWASIDPYLVEPGAAGGRRIVSAATVMDSVDGVALLAVDRREVASVAASVPTADMTLSIVSRSAE